jgi:hypothetical protein
MKDTGNMSTILLLPFFEVGYDFQDKLFFNAGQFPNFLYMKRFKYHRKEWGSQRSKKGSDFSEPL